MILVSIWRGSAVRWPRSAAAGTRQVELQRMVASWLLVITVEVLVLVLMVMVVVVVVMLMVGAVVVARILLQMGMHFIDRLGTAVAAGSGYHLPATDRKRRRRLLALS